MTRKLDPRTGVLLGSSLFQACTPKELTQLGSLTTDIDVVAGETLCQEGRFGSEFFVIVEGRARVTIQGEEVARLGPGGFFGEMALLDGGYRTATVTALTPMRLLVMTRREFNSALGIAPGVDENVLSAATSRRRAVEARMPTAIAV